MFASDFVMIRNFGIATALGVLLCLVAAVVVMPRLVVWWDEKIARRLAEKL